MRPYNPPKITSFAAQWKTIGEAAPDAILYIESIDGICFPVKRKFWSNNQYAVSENATVFNSTGTTFPQDPFGSYFY